MLIQKYLSLKAGPVRKFWNAAIGGDGDGGKIWLKTEINNNCHRNWSNYVWNHVYSIKYKCVSFTVYGVSFTVLGVHFVSFSVLILHIQI